MSYKWKPSPAQRREFAIRMKDPDEAAAYEARKNARQEKRRSESKLAFTTAGGFYVPTKEQYDFALMNVCRITNSEHEDAFNEVIYGYTCNSKVLHDSIHIVNAYRRGDLLL